jgi:hypothetical protein
MRPLSLGRIPYAGAAEIQGQKLLCGKLVIFDLGFNSAEGRHFGRGELLRHDGTKAPRHEEKEIEVARIIAIVLPSDGSLQRRPFRGCHATERSGVVCRGASITKLASIWFVDATGHTTALRLWRGTQRRATLLNAMPFGSTKLKLRATMGCRTSGGTPEVRKRRAGRPGYG